MLRHFIASPLKQLDDTVSADEMQRSDNDQIVMITSKQSSDRR